MSETSGSIPTIKEAISVARREIEYWELRRNQLEQKLREECDHPKDQVMQWTTFPHYHWAKRCTVCGKVWNETKEGGRLYD